jgi:hypothetical protein
VIFGLVPVWGYLGAALSTLLLFCHGSRLLFLWSKIFPYSISNPQRLVLSSFAFGLSYLGFYIELDQPVLQFITRNSLVIVFVLVVLWLEREELKKILQSIEKKKKMKIKVINQSKHPLPEYQTPLGCRT